MAVSKRYIPLKTLTLLYPLEPLIEPIVVAVRGRQVSHVRAHDQDLSAYCSLPAAISPIHGCINATCIRDFANTIVPIRAIDRTNPRHCSKQLIVARFHYCPERSDSTTTSKLLALQYSALFVHSSRHTKLCLLFNLFSLVTARAANPRTILWTKPSLRALCASVLSGVFCAAAKLSHSILMRSTVSAAICVVSTS
jgi:hypothetical protein